MNSFLKALGVLLFYSQFAFPQDKTVTYLDDEGCKTTEKVIDINHLNAELSINPYDTLVTGSVTFSFRPIRIQTDSIVFWAPDIIFSKVEIPGIEISFVKKGDNLVIYNLSKDKLQKDKDFEVRMNYTSKPQYDLFLIGWKEPALRKNKQIWAHRPFHWLPYYGDRLTVDMFITFDGKYQVFSNGVRESVKTNADGTKTWHYKMSKEHPFFSTALVIGDYKYLEIKTKDGLPLELCYYSWQEDHAEPTYRYTAQMFDFLKEETGLAYPYELYRETPVEDYLYGAMETTTSTVFGDYLAVDERAWDLRNYVNVNAHELAHQWFGNCLSHQKSCDVWLTESFGTYYAKLFEKEVFGADYYQWVRNQEFDEALEASKKDQIPVGNSRGGRARWYPKGSLVLDMMRDVLGDDGFKASVKYYTNHYQFSEVETSEFVSSVHEATGQSIEWFFDEWIHHAGEPFYEVNWQAGKSPEGSDQTIIRVKQAHERNELIGLFKMPIVFEVHYKDGNFDRKTQWIEDEYSEVTISNPGAKAVSFVLFDPGRKVLKTVSFNKSIEEWSAQALNAQGMIDRYDALVALRNFPLSQKETTLLGAWKKETFHLTRTEVIRQLYAEEGKSYNDIFLQAINDNDPLVKRAALENVRQVPENLKTDVEKLLGDQSYIVVEKALDLLSRSFSQDIPKFLEATKNETGWRGKNIRMKWLEIAIQAGQREYLRELTDYADPHYEFETRMNAFQLLKRLNYLDKPAASNLISGYLYWNSKVSNSAKEVLVYFYQQNRFKELIDKTLEESDFLMTDKDKVKKMLAESKQ